jgi:hypothetical protein
MAVNLVELDCLLSGEFDELIPSGEFLEPLSFIAFISISGGDDEKTDFMANASRVDAIARGLRVFNLSNRKL